MSPSGRAWLLSGGFTVVGIGLLWWAHRQRLALEQIAGSTFQIPSVRLLLWMLTLIVTGFSFGMAASSAKNSVEPGRAAILLTLAFIPFAVLYYVWTQLTLGWFPRLPGNLFRFLYSESTLLAASVILGLFLSGLVGSVRSVDQPALEPADVAPNGEGDAHSEE